MIYDLKSYRHVIKPQIKKWCEGKDADPADLISELAIGLQCPIIAVCYFVGELYGFTPKLNKSIESLTVFYTPEAVINKEEGPSGKVE